MGSDDDKKTSSKKDSKKKSSKSDKKESKKDDKKKTSSSKEESKKKSSKSDKKESKKDDKKIDDKKKKDDKKDEKKSKKSSKESKRKHEKRDHGEESVEQATIQRLSTTEEDLALMDLPQMAEEHAEALEQEPEPVDEPYAPASAKPDTNEMMEKTIEKDALASDDASATSNSKSDDEMDDEMKALMAEFAGSDSDSTSSSSSTSDASEEVRSVELKENVLDHVVLAASDIESAITEFTEKTGIVPRVALAIKGLGIKVARVSFEGPSFLEIIAPDPDHGGPIGSLLKASGAQALTPFHWAIRTSRTDQLKDEVTQFGYVPDNIGMAGARKDGTPRRWEMTYLYGHKCGGICPFFINWANSDHPCETMPIVGDLIHVKVSAPEDDPIHKLIEYTGSEGFTLVEGSPAFEIKFDSPEGEVSFGTTKMTGFKFPGFNEESDEELDVVETDE